MILSQVNLRAAVKAGQIGFDPSLEDRQWGEASVDLRLGFSFTKLEKAPGLVVSVADGLGTLGRSGFFTTKELKRRDEFGDPETFILHPGHFILGMTHESIRVPTNMIALIEGRSTYARVGLSMHQTAPWIQPGWSGKIIYKAIGREFASHESVNHGKKEYVRGDVSTNTVEGFYSVFKRGMKGVYQHCSERHLHRYLAEFDFRYSNRVRLGVDDVERTELALKGIVGKRLTYRTTPQRAAVWQEPT